MRISWTSQAILDPFLRDTASSGPISRDELALLLRMAIVVKRESALLLVAVLFVSGAVLLLNSPDSRPGPSLQYRRKIHGRLNRF